MSIPMSPPGPMGGTGGGPPGAMPGQGGIPPQILMALMAAISRSKSKAASRPSPDAKKAAIQKRMQKNG